MEIHNILSNIDIILKRKNNIDQIMNYSRHYKYKLITYKYDNMIPPGITNIGNSCFHNSIIQLFYRIYELRDFLISNKIKNQYSDNSTVIHGFINLLNLMYDLRKDNTGQIITDQKLKDRNIDIRYCLHNIFGSWFFSSEDAQQFMIGIIDKLMADCPTNDFKAMNQICVKEVVNMKDTIVKKKRLPDNDPRNFMTINCETYDYPVEINPFGDDNKKIIKYGKNNFNKFKNEYAMIKPMIKKETLYMIQIYITNYNKKYHIEDLIKVAYNSFSKNNKTDLDLIHKDNEYDNNKDYLCIRTYNYIPNKYLIIQMWGSEGEKVEYSNNSQKIKHHVQLETNGDMNFEYHVNGIVHVKIYELIGVSYHSGSLISGGHFYANVKYGNQWYEYNDSNVSKIDTYEKGYQERDSIRTPYIVLYGEKTNSPIEYIDPFTVPNDIMDYLVDN